VLVRGWSSLILAVVFCSGFIIFLLRIVLEYLALLVLHAHGKPIFFVADRRADAILVDYFSNVTHDHGRTRGSADAWRPVIALFGHGLIGRSITAALGKSKQARWASLPFTWDDGQPGPAN
jgi:hypothetical protein